MRTHVADRNRYTPKNHDFESQQQLVLDSQLTSHGRGHWFDPSTAHQIFDDVSIT